MTDETSQRIDHAKVMDGFGQLRGHEVYRPIATFCGICDEPIELSAREQKYLLEVKGVPVKFLRRGAAYCQRCTARRARINYLRRGDRWRQEPEAADELARLRAEERDHLGHSRQRFRGAEWPYGAG